MFDRDAGAREQRDPSIGSPSAPATAEGDPPKLPVLIVMHGEHSCPGRVGQLLRRKGHALDVRKPRFGDPLPSTLAGYAGAVVFGGPMSANDPDDYIKAEIDWIGVPLREERPLLGICLGAQLMAKHLGCSVKAHPKQRVEIGYCDVRPTTSGSLLGPWPSKFYHWHREGFEIPATADCLATGDDFPNQAYRFGPAAIGVQFHPEITHTLVNTWTTDASSHLAQPGAQPKEQQLMGHIIHARSVKSWLEELLTRWLDGNIMERQPQFSVVAAR